MNIIRTLIWVIFAVALAVFWVVNERRVDLDLGAFILNARASSFVIAAFLGGFVPMWLYHRTMRWRLKRRIATLESQAATPPVTYSSTSLDKASSADTLSSV